MTWKLKRVRKEIAIDNVATLKQWAAEGRILREDYLYNPVLEQWLYAKDTVEIQDSSAQGCQKEAKRLNSLGLGFGIGGLPLPHAAPHAPGRPAPPDRNHPDGGPLHQTALNQVAHVPASVTRLPIHFSGDPMAIHPRLDDKSKQVHISKPNQPTPLPSWGDSCQVALVVPDGPMPHKLNHVLFRTWKKAPVDRPGWSHSPGSMRKRRRGRQLGSPPSMLRASSPQRVRWWWRRMAEYGSWPPQRLGRRQGHLPQGPRQRS